MTSRCLLFAFRLTVAVGLTLGLLALVDGGREYTDRIVAWLTGAAGLVGGFFFLVNELSWSRAFRPDEPPYLPVEAFSMSSGALGMGLTFFAFKGLEVATSPLDAIPAVTGTLLYALLAAAVGSVLGGLAGASLES